ncbi:MAG TPA: Rab family GTPase [Candidatus Lokiarchaeia archaeon]|nr:Rab family GTPase [Candidatus Lokiarchaeia archaeon]
MTDIVWKVVVGGSGGVGKTTFLHRYLTKQFLQDTKMTVGVSFQSHKIVRQGKNITVVLWDLGGQERFRFLLSNYIKGAVAAFLMFDLSRINTLWELREWIDLIRGMTSASIPLILIGSKLDMVLPENLPHKNEEAEKFAEEMNLVQYITISSKSGENVEQAMENMIDILLWQKDQGIIQGSIAPKNL